MQFAVQTMSQHTLCWQVFDAHSVFSVHAAPSTLRPHSVPLQTLPVEQSMLSRQLTRQVPVLPHMYAPQDTLPAGAQVPAPSQCQGAVPFAVPVVQVASLQMVAFEYISHPPAPSQKPSAPQVSRPLSAHWPSGSLPAGTAVQAPSLPGTAHDMQLPVHIPLQHTPCWQLVELQSSPVVHVAPSGFLPQLPLLHTLPAAQSALAAHVFRQALAALVSHTYGSQGRPEIGLHTPASQRDASVSVDPLQVAWRQVAPVG